MSDLLIHPSDPDADGQVIHITPQSAGWKHVGFDLHLLAAGHSLSRKTESREVCLVMVAGTADIGIGDKHYNSDQK